MLANDILAQTDLALTSSHTNVEGFYFVAAHTDGGTRFYSDPIATFENAEEIFDNYVDLVTYFKGGYVNLYKINADDYEVIAYVRI